jgi:hypothetical protein
MRLNGGSAGAWIQQLGLECPVPGWALTVEHIGPFFGVRSPLGGRKRGRLDCPVCSMSGLRSAFSVERGAGLGKADP